MEVASPSRWPATPRWTDKRERAHAALRRAKRQAANQLFRVRVSCTAVGGLCLLVSLPLMFLNGSVLDFRDHGLLGVVAIMGPLVAAIALRGYDQDEQFVTMNGPNHGRELGRASS